MKRYKRHRDRGFFDQDIRLIKLSHLGGLLEKLKAGIGFDIFRPQPEKGSLFTRKRHSGQIGAQWSERAASHV